MQHLLSLRLSQMYDVIRTVYFKPNTSLIHTKFQWYCVQLDTSLWRGSLTYYQNSKDNNGELCLVNIDAQQQAASLCGIQKVDLISGYSVQ